MVNKIFLTLLFSTFQIFSEKHFFYPPYNETKAFKLRKQNSNKTNSCSTKITHLQSQTTNFKESVDRISKILDVLHGTKKQTKVCPTKKESRTYDRLDTCSSSAGISETSNLSNSTIVSDKNYSRINPVIDPDLVSSFFPLVKYSQA